MKLKLFMILIAISSVLLSGCGGSRSTTVIIVQDPTPLQTYTINITKMSALNPIGDIYVKVRYTMNMAVTKHIPQAKA